MSTVISSIKLSDFILKMLVGQREPTLSEVAYLIISIDVLRTKV